MGMLRLRHQEADAAQAATMNSAMVWRALRRGGGGGGGGGDDGDGDGDGDDDEFC